MEHSNPTSKNTRRKGMLEMRKLRLPAATNNHFPQQNKEISGLLAMDRLAPLHKPGLIRKSGSAAPQPGAVLAQQFLPMI